METSRESRIPTSENPLFAAVFSNKKGDEAFFPYEEAVSDSKSEAKRWARQMNAAVHAQCGLRWNGSLIKLTGAKYPLVELPVGDKTMHLAAIKGPVFDACNKEGGIDAE